MKEKVDFSLLFWMLHETPQQKKLFRQIYDILKLGGHLYLAEPTMHVSESEFEGFRQIAKSAGFKRSCGA